MTKNNEIMSILDSAYRELCKWDMRSAINDNPVAALTFFTFLKYVSDNKEQLELKYEEKYNFDYLVLLFGEKIGHGELVAHVSSIEKQLGFDYRILESFVDSLDLNKVNRPIIEVLAAINRLDLEVQENNKFAAYDSLVNYISMQSKKELRFPEEYVTDINLARLMSEIADIDNGMSVYDFAVGYGISLSTATRNKKVEVAAQDINKVCAAVSIMILVMSGNKGADIRCDDTISHPLTIRGDKNMTFDRVISAPPFGFRRSDIEATIQSGQQANAFEYGLSYKLTGDLVFARHLLASLNEEGVGILQIPMGSLFRGGMEEKIRTQMIEDNYIDAVIELPSGIVAGTNIKTALIVFKKNRKSTGVYFLDLARDGAKDYTERVGRVGTSLTEEGVSTIRQLVFERKEIDGLSRVINKADMIANGSNLCPGAYLQQAISEAIEVPDINFLLKRREVLQNKLLQLDKEFIEILQNVDTN